MSSLETQRSIATVREFIETQIPIPPLDISALAPPLPVSGEALPESEPPAKPVYKQLEEDELHPVQVQAAIDAIVCFHDMVLHNRKDYMSRLLAVCFAILMIIMSLIGLEWISQQSHSHVWDAPPQRIPLLLGGQKATD